jgi:membrane-bound ClpP family serine protease
MTSTRRHLVALVLMSVGVVALIVSSVDEGWTTLGGVAVACLGVAIAAQLVELRRRRAS